MNVELLREIAKVIQEKPQEFDMDYFTGYTECGTTHCIGGWASKLTGNSSMREASMREALDIDVEQGERLFYVDGVYGGWPEQFRGVDDEWKPTPAQAAARIEHFIATDGRE